MTNSTACATCAAQYGNPLDPMSEKPLLPGRDLECCRRSICSRCLNQNKRYETYCPYCQISTTASSLPQGLRDPPPYSPPSNDSKAPSSNQPDDEGPPAYSDHHQVNLPPEKATATDAEPAPDVLHFLTPNDTIQSLGLAYGVPAYVLRKANSVYADHLLQGRKTVIIPGEYYKGGVSLSPQPIMGEEEEARRNMIRRWMVACKVAEYDVALLYLQQAEWNLQEAIAAYRDDEQWEKDHPLEAKQNAKKGRSAKTVGMRRFVGAQAGPSSSSR